MAGLELDPLVFLNENPVVRCPQERMRKAGPLKAATATRINYLMVGILFRSKVARFEEERKEMSPSCIWIRGAHQ